MKVKLFWKKNPVKLGIFGSKDDATSVEDEINIWLRDHRHIEIVDISQSATGGSWGPMLWLISVWYEEGDSESASD